MSRRLPEIGGATAGYGLFFAAHNVANILNYAFLLAMSRALAPGDFALFAALFGAVYLASALASTGQTQEQASNRLGLDRSTIANMVRLLDLPEEVKDLVRAGRVAMGHARAILAVSDPKRQAGIARRGAEEGLSVRQVQRIVHPAGPAKRRKAPPEKSPHVRDLERRLREALGSKVTIEEGRKPGTGKIVIEFYSDEDVERILSILR